jgi:uncharacterized membrane protein
MWSLLGIPVVLVGLLVRLNPLVVVTAAAVVAGIGGGLEHLAIFPHFPGMAREQAIEQLERFSGQIMPRLLASPLPADVGV